MVHGNIHDIYFMIQILDRRYCISIKISKQYILHLVAEMILRGAFQSRGFLLILYRERKILVKPSFNKSEWVTDWSNLMLAVLQLVYPLH